MRTGADLSAIKGAVEAQDVVRNLVTPHTEHMHMDSNEHKPVTNV